MEPLTDALDRLGRRVADEQDELVLAQTGELDTVRRRLSTVSPQPRRRSVHVPRWSRLAVAALTLAALGAVVLFWLRRPAALAFVVTSEEARSSGAVGEWLSADRGEVLDLDFSDGSRLTLAERTRARVIEVDARGASVLVESGHVDVAITPRPQSSWHVNLGPFVVQVTGTRFAVEWDPENELLMLAMHEGSVQVSGCMFDAARPFEAGQVLRASCREQRYEIQSRAAAELPATEPEEAPLEQPDLADVAAPEPLEGDTALLRDAAQPEAQPAAPSAPPSSAPRARPSESSWQALLREGRYEEAFAAAAALGFEDECEQASAADLLALADAARYAGELSRARHGYSVLRRRFPGDDRASVAAFTLARIAFDQRRNYSEAAEWFGTYLRERPSGALAREALGRLMESLDRAGDHDGARRMAERYLQRYGNGPHAELARRLSQP